MFNVKRAAVLAVSAGLAAVPVVGLQGASASTGALPPPQPAKVCHPEVGRRLQRCAVRR